jgi:hypothetical protein
MPNISVIFVFNVPDLLFFSPLFLHPYFPAMGMSSLPPIKGTPTRKSLPSDDLSVVVGEKSGDP